MRKNRIIAGFIAFLIITTMLIAGFYLYLIRSGSPAAGEEAKSADDTVPAQEQKGGDNQTIELVRPPFLDE